jgi:hypothetical protein
MTLRARQARANSFLRDAAVEEMNRAVGHAGIARFVRDHADCGAPALQLAQLRL